MAYGGYGTNTTPNYCRIVPALCPNDSGSSGGGSEFPRPNTQTNTQPKIYTNAGGVIAQSGQTTLDKILGTFLSSVALFKNAPYVPTAVVPQQQPQVIYQPSATENYNGGSGGSGIGSQIENLITNNTGLILIGGLAFVLFKSGRK